MKRLILRLMPVADILLTPLVYPCALLLKLVRRAGVQRLPWCKRALLNVGVFPIRNHYYEPQFDHRSLRWPLTQDRKLPGIEWNAGEQLSVLSTFTFAAELADLSTRKGDGLDFHLENLAFESGDAEYWYQLIRTVKPRRIVEVGSGNSTLMAIRALRKNREEDPHYECRHVCVEPYEMPWLEQTGALIVRKRVEELPLSFFAELEERDILFLDSSHVIRPQGDVLFEYLEVLPALRRGVIVHAHDIFTPKDYLRNWVIEEVKFWNEQYLLEAFLSQNRSWKILGALNYLHHHHYNELKAVAPSLTPESVPGSFYIQRVE